MKKRKFKLSKLLLHIFFMVFSLCFIIPLWSIASISLSNEVDILNYGFRLIPISIDLTAYKFVFENPTTILQSYKVTLLMSFGALVIYLFMSSMCAYSLSRSNFTHRKWIAFYIVFTMLFNAGMVPTYLLYTQYLHIQNTYAALILPLVGSVMYLFVMRTFFNQLPNAICEAAVVDGAGEFYIYWKIILPLSKPVLATVGVLTVMDSWNSWNQALLYIDDSNLYPLQYLLQIMLRNLQEITNNMDKRPAGMLVTQNIPSESTRMAMAIIAVGPMLFIFPFFQKYFVGGLTMGSVKG